ncbi:helix-turn-helix domain-containing protein [Mycobacterium sp. ITM-2016-00317]|uniref:helix-turn-helix transcriptional regulator n=1 Tax=Mycobacterium sp. ITM-2016-00317 TaxID=2099694 RepID=UPI000D4FC75D|nr:helix-turn-helix domain-containing protein [Mycobacterium sp. ITM-2016-00317]WNG87475.1 helix-turn-helix domain-containing protein [Mycobacterium sp. ITM-2016-00317]
MTAEPDGDLLAAVVEAAPTPLWVIAGTGRVQLVNRAALALLGYPTAGDLIGRPSHHTLHACHPDGTEYPQQTCPIVGNGGVDPGPRTGTEWFTTRSGRHLPVRWSTRRLNGCGATLLAFEDASEQVRAGTPLPRWHGLSGRTRSATRADLVRQVQQNFRDPEFGVAVLARDNHMSVRAVQALFAEIGRTPADEIRRARLEFASRLLHNGAAVQTACYDSGFRDPGTFTRAFRRYFGCPPSGVRHRWSA